jgi:3,4-dihydroxy 2-butanone 4-phosphate synthase/GTP cyclohydrolase II
MHRAPLVATDPSRFAHVAAAIEAIAAGKMVILVDDEDRENEGDLVLAADLVTP